MNKLIYSTLVTSIFLMGNVADAFTLNLGANSAFTNSALTGASTTVDFGFTAESGGTGVVVDMTITNTTGSSSFGDGATSATMTAFAFDIIDNTTLRIGSDSASNGLSNLLTNPTFNPFGNAGFPLSDGVFDYAASNDNNIEGGNPNNNSLANNQQTVVSFILDGIADVNAVEQAFFNGFSNGDLDYAARFQQVSGDGNYSGSGSEKLLGGIVTGGNTTGGNTTGGTTTGGTTTGGTTTGGTTGTTPVPEPSTYAMFGLAAAMLGFISYRSRNRRS